MEKEVYRILVVDDLASIHDDFRKILAAEHQELEKLKELEQLLFEDTPAEVLAPEFIIDSAFQGEQGIELVKRSLEEGRPYSVAFVDVIMPPGIDGIDTIIGMWALDPNIQMVIITAYSTYNWNEIVKRLGVSEQLYTLKKPFDPIEIVNLAVSLSKRWSTSKLIKRQLAKIELILTSSEMAADTDTKEALQKVYQALEELKNLNTQLNECSVKKQVN